MTATYQPVQGKDVRIVFNPELRQFEVQQVFIRTAPGSTYANDLESVVDLGQEVWNTIALCTTVKEALTRIFQFAYVNNVAMRSIDLGPVQTTDAAYREAYDSLARFLL